MTKTKANKGFTLTEIIVVIAIIGILSAVLITAITGYIEKAKKSNDTQLAGQMSREIQNYCVENDINQPDITGIDIRTILSAKGFNMVPSTKKWTYVYNREEKKVEIKTFNKDSVLADAGERSDLTEVVPGYFLLGKGSSTIEKAVELLALGDVTGFESSIGSNYETYKTFVSENYSFTKVLYINANGVVNPDAIVSGTYSKVVLCEHVNYIPNI